MAAAFFAAALRFFVRAAFRPASRRFRVLAAFFAATCRLRVNAAFSPADAIAYPSSFSALIHVRRLVGFLDDCSEHLTVLLDVFRL